MTGQEWSEIILIPISENDNNGEVEILDAKILLIGEITMLLHRLKIRGNVVHVMHFQRIYIF